MASAKAPADYYALLGVPQDAAFRQISDAYWRLAAEKRDQLPLLNEAYEVLSHPQRRLAYDEQYDGPAQPAEAEQEPRAVLQRKPGVREKLNWYLR
jgi:curved DNA-binding protein CbpA